MPHEGAGEPSPGEILRDETTTSRFASGAAATGPGNGGFGSVVTTIPVADENALPDCELHARETTRSTSRRSGGTNRLRTAA